ncbi:M56 family metallopeptidase [Longimicrobium sp.]|jgi:Zn-dependent protease with chaperone function|uniref:M56 family metallopeptidase n=1 Tax=Longimicrobium sp. TaxID=2029185 RepID=UPI002EDAB5C8
MSATAPGRSPALVTREEAHRRTLLLGIGTLLLFSVSPLFGHHFAAGLEQGLRGQDHLGALCLIALHTLLRPVHLLFHVLLVVGLAYALYDRFRAARRVRATLASLHSAAPAEGDAFWTAAAAAKIDPATVRVVRGLPNPAFTAGWLRPRVYVAAALADRLSANELQAVLAHEGAHVARRDPLRLSLLRLLALTLFWLPVLRRLADDVADEAEIQADDRAAREQPLALASAILSLASWRTAGPAWGEGVGFAQRMNLLDRRIRRLAGEEPAPVSRLTRRSVVGAMLALALVGASGAIMSHPLPVDHMAHPSNHCGHPGESPFGHLFCRWDVPRQAGRLCPHAPVA